MLPQETFQRIDIMRFPLIVGVVFAHAYPGTSNNIITVFVYNLICNGLVRIAVPLLFLISGYLFFINFDLSKQTYWKKIQARRGSLFIPFLIWNCATLLIFALAQTIPATRIYFSGVNAPISSYGLFDYFNAILGLDRMPIAMQFWFIRDLMLLVLLTPVIQFLNRYVPLLFLMTLYICWMLGYWPVHIPAVEPVFFFSAGAFLGSRKYNIFALDKYGILMISIYVPTLLFTSLFVENPLAPYLHRIGIMLGIISAMYLSKQLVTYPQSKNKLLELSAISFFVFATHEPVQLIMRKLVYRILMPESWLLELALYFIIPTCIIFFLVSAYNFLGNVAPNILKIITGKRAKS